MKVALSTINLNLLVKLYFVIYTDFVYVIFRVNRMIQERLNHAKAVSDVYANRFRFMVLNATFINISVISWQSVLLVEDNRIPRENHRPVSSH
jgi:hypothetical protein